MGLLCCIIHEMFKTYFEVWQVCQNYVTLMESHTEKKCLHTATISVNKMFFFFSVHVSMQCLKVNIIHLWWNIANQGKMNREKLTVLRGS